MKPGEVMEPETSELGELSSYRDRLRRYTTEELEDVYFNIHILRHPVKYRLLLMEMERRGLARPAAAPARKQIDLRDWLASRPLLTRRPAARAALLCALLFAVSAGATFGMLLPIWLFAVPLHFIGLETAIVYFACAPVPPILGAAFGGRLGGRGWYSVWPLLGAAAGMYLFDLTGAPATILHAILKPQGGGGFSIGF